MSKISIFILVLSVSACSGSIQENEKLHIFMHYLMAGEPGQTSIIFQSRLAASDTIIYEDVHDPEKLMQTDLPGKAGFARFEYGNDPELQNKFASNWLEAAANSDFIIKYKVDNLEPGTQYYYRLCFGEDTSRLAYSDIQSFGTLPARDSESTIAFTMVTGSHLARFYLGGGFGAPSSQGVSAYRGEDKYEGFHGFETMAGMQPDFFISNGDNVYYDHPPKHSATTLEEMRSMWHRQFFMPRMRHFLASVPVFWMKDDHDHRFDDSDTVAINKTFGTEPSNELGIRTFIEQVPVVDPESTDPKTYRTVRVNKDVQLWMVEGRDYRSPNALPDGPEKSIWGIEQKKWLKETLKESDATFKILVTPTPMVGPDGAGKTDSHANPDGFMHEGNEFFAWLAAEGFSPNNFFILTGDRHWQYHSIHPSGYHEFSCGAMVDQNSRLGIDPGTPNSNDPDGKIQQPYTSREPSGGFLMVKAVESAETEKHVNLLFYDENGEELYTYTISAN
ncbi:MAG: alkaline phosphatase D family protein [Cyclobacteriaceae bacterium]